MLVWDPEGKEKENSQGQFFCPTCNRLRPYTYQQVSQGFIPCVIPLFETRSPGDAVDAVECQVCRNGFDPRVLEPPHQGALKLVAATRHELLHGGASPAEARDRLEAVGLAEDMVETLLRMAQA
jgi:hypothetical protein